uniref:Reverse transcriptase domain-containing protein n=1 Tax=Tanacetum cinerariifolium TaxID=118510 RepID=A0A6L2NXC4_TANCI|nr:reverse transcriptase domain-containing protein [Tanacetum cinerariifolium]
MIQQVQNSCQFHGLPGDDANKYLDKFLHVTQSIKVNGVTDDALHLYLFPYSLTHHVTAWFDRFPRNSITTFEQIAKMFFGKYFPPSMVTKLRNEITNFHQRPDESLFEAWEHYKLSIDRCPNHNMLPVTQIDTFYKWLTLRHRDIINAAASGTFMKRQILALKAEMAEINKNLMKVLHINQQVKVVAHNCETCGDVHSYNDCPAIVGLTQNVYAARAYNQGGNSYQPQGNRNLLSYRSNNYLGPPGFNQNQNRSNPNQNYQNQNRNHGNNHGIPQGNNQGRNQFFQGASHGQNPTPAYQAPTYQAPAYQALVHHAPIPQPQVVTTTEFTNYMKANDAILKNMQTNMTSDMNTASSSGSRTLPVVEHETEVTKDTVPPTNNESTKDVQPSVVQIETPIPNSEPVVAPIVEPVEAPVSAPKPNLKPSIPYPSRLHDQKLCDKSNDQKEKYLQIFKDLDFNISSADALILMPKFGSTIKCLLANKEKLFELARTPLNEHCSAVLLKKLPAKLGDPGKFLIPCDFSGMDECLALADLGASINLMPLFIWNKLSLLELSPTCMTLELAERLISRPVGVVEDVFVKLGTFHFPADFVVVDFDADPRVPLILERSFLETGRAFIDVYKGELTLRVANRIDLIDVACEEYSQEVLGFLVSGNHTLSNERIVSNSSPTLTPFRDSDFLFEETDAFLVIDDEPISLEIDDCYYNSEGDILLLEECLTDDPSSPPLPSQELKVVEPSNEKYSIDEPPVVELKDLPPHLEYAFLEGDDKLPVIIAKDLKDEEKTTLIKVLKSHKQALAWQLSDIKGINPEFYTHKILIEDDFKPVVQHQRKINPKIHEVIKKEVLKLLDAGLICPVSDSPWDAKPRLLRWVLLLQEFDITVRDKKGAENQPKPLIFSRLAIMDPSGDIMARTTPPKRCLTPVSTGPQSIMMPTTWSNLVTLFNVREKFRNGMKCLKIPSKFARFSTYRPSISWGHSRLHKRTTFKTPIRCTLYKLMYEKTCHLPIEREHKAYWALKHYNYDLLTAGNHQKVQLNELNELHDQAYENSLIYKEKTKRIHDSKIKDRVFNVGGRVLLFNSRLKIFSGKLKTRWTGPFTITQVFPCGTIELSQTDGPNFKVNGHRLKRYFGEDIPKMVVPDLQTFPQGPMNSGIGSN